ncbi:helix-turn-helix domain-containing protein [Streptomyces avermitilis]
MLKQLRVQRGLSQAELAGDGMSTGYLSRLESGQRPPTERAVQYLATQLGVEESAFDVAPSPPLVQLLATATSDPMNQDHTAPLTAAAYDDTADPAFRWQALWLLVTAPQSQDDVDEKTTQLHTLVELSDHMGVNELRARARVQQARHLRSLGRIDEALRAASEATAIATQQQLPTDTAAALMVLISLEAEAGQLDLASSHTVQLDTLLDEITATSAAEALWTGAVVQARRGDYEYAFTRLERAISMVSSHDNITLWLRLRLAAASLALQARPPRIDIARTRLIDIARTRLTEVEPVMSFIGSPSHKQEFTLLQAQLAYYEGDLQTAIHLLDHLAAEPSLLTYRDATRLALFRGLVHIRTGDSARGAKELQNLAEQATTDKHHDVATTIWQALAVTLTQLHQQGDGASP